MTRLARTIITVAGIAVGATALMLGEADDSPGLGGIGLIVAGSCSLWWWRNRKRP